MRRFMIGQHRKSAGIKHVKLIVAATLILLSIFVIWIVVSKQQQKDTISSSESAGQYEAQSIDIGSLSSSGDASLLTSQSLSINGQLRANNSLILTPTNRPGSATTGQLYYDAETNTPYLYDGEEYQALLTGQAIRSIGGANGNITLGTGILLSNNQLSIDGNLLAVVSQAANNIAGVQSIQGRGGDVAFTAGSGIGINGTTITNNGVVSITAASPQLSVTSTGAGVYSVGTVGNLVSGTGTAGAIAMFDSASNVVSSLLTQTGTVLSAAGDVQVTGQLQTDTIASLTTTDLNINAGNNNIVFTSGGRTYQLPATGGANQTICTVGMDCTLGGGGSYIVLQPSTAQEDTGSGPSVFINNSGGGELLHLQGNGLDSFVVSNDGDGAFAGDLAVSGTINGATISGGNISGGMVNGAIINGPASITGGNLTDTSVNGLGVSSTAITSTGALSISAASNSNLNLNTSGTGVITLGTSLMQGTGSLTLAAGGTDQDLILAGSGTGNVVIETPLFHNANGASYTFDSTDLATTSAVICTSIG
ncbi:MAG: beta strand repeat-containing protein, partial [Candidatus Saccharimonadales bacterium]